VYSDQSQVSLGQTKTHLRSRRSRPTEDLLGGRKLQNILRTSPCCDHPLLTQFDEVLRLAMTKICNLSLTDDQWLQASLPVWSGGIGVRSVVKLAPSAFLASAAGTLPLQDQILQKIVTSIEDNSIS